ncbi:unnamed protein product [Vicia faba]|uniref:Uncharacterized protein n=1 Tax=Vicia faba TaxID=3906 RepID=A0AAV0ZDV0_VICFA|nr:unnamed protein product [Vicia faba]
MKMRFALVGSCRREDIPACGRGRGTGLLDFEFEQEGRDDKGIGQRHLSSHRRSGPNLIKGCLALPKGEESLGTDSLTSPPAADRTRASIYSTALTVTEKTGTGFKKLTLAAVSDSITPERIILRASRLRASSQAAYFVRGLTIDSIAQRSLVVLRADSGTASIPRGALTLAAFYFTTLSITTSFSSYGSKLSQVPSLPSCLFDRSLHSQGEFFYIK